jgi:amino acid adenylation domain-containing protein
MADPRHHAVSAPMPREMPMLNDVDDSFPLSEQQIALVRSVEVHEDPSNRYTVSILSCHLPLDRQLLDHAIDETVARYPVLRSCLDFAPGRDPRQVVHDGVTAPVSVVDLRDTPAQDQTDAIMDSLRAESAQPFELTRAPLIRVSVYQVRDEEFRFAVLSHPAVLDRWSLHAFYVDVLARYRQPKEGLAYCGAERSGGASVAADVDLARWVDAFADFTPSQPEFWMTEPDDGARSGDGVPDTAATVAPSRLVVLPDDLARELDTLAIHLDVSAADVLLAAHAKAVGVATGRFDVVVGVETQSWDHTVPRTLDMLTTVVPVRLSVAPGTWAELVRRVAALSAAARQFRQLSHHRVRRQLGVDQLLDSSFACSDAGIEADLLDGEAGLLALASGGLKGEAATGFACMPFEGAVFTEFFRGPNTGRVALRMTAGRGLLTRQLRAFMRVQMEALAHCVHADEQHQALSPLTARHLEVILRQSKGPTRPYPAERCVHELVEQQARRTPEAIAVIDAEREQTYRELNARANRLAHRLRAEGIRVGSVVGVCATRDTALVASFLGILKAGAAYLPLDPQQPADRAAYMLDDAGAAVVVSDSRYAGTVPAGPWSVLRTDDPSADATGFPETNLGRTSTPDDLMYVIYTSGSTGPPKGVEVPHSGIVNYLGWCAEAYAARGRGGAAVFSSVAFDMIVPNLYTPLVMGQRVCVLDETLDMQTVAERLTAWAPFSFLKLTPGQLGLLSELLDADEARHLTEMLAVGADAFPVRILRNWRRIDSGTPVLNEYGPTEASVGNCVHVVDGAEQGDLLPIGRPIPNTTMYVLDSTLAPVPIGVPGELYIGGACVVRGYLNRPALTLERFIADPFSAQPGARMYRTGDIGRWMPGGALAFLGRIDDQAKIRGYRVEPGEIEAALVEHPSISEAVVTVVGSARETLSLAGYYVGGPDLAAEEVREYLAGRLPDYLVPSFLIPIPAIPLNANGKVDRKSLPPPGGSSAAVLRQKAAVASDVGLIVQQVWKKVFGMNSVRLDDSLDAAGCGVAEEAQLALRLAQTVGIDTARAFRLVSSVNTFGELSAQLAREQARGRATEHVTTCRGGRVAGSSHLRRKG